MLSNLQHLGHRGEMTREVAFGAFRYAFAAPAYQGILWEGSVWIFDFDKSKLDPAIRELVDQLRELTIYRVNASAY